MHIIIYFIHLIEPNEIKQLQGVVNADEFVFLLIDDKPLPFETQRGVHLKQTDFPLVYKNIVYFLDNKWEAGRFSMEYQTIISDALETCLSGYGIQKEPVS